MFGLDRPNLHIHLRASHRKRERIKPIQEMIQIEVLLREEMHDNLSHGEVTIGHEKKRKSLKVGWIGPCSRQPAGKQRKKAEI